MRTYHCPGFRPVQANTKGEARAKFKEQLREEQLLTFSPTRVKRLPSRIKITAGELAQAG